MSDVDDDNPDVSEAVPAKVSEYEELKKPGPVSRDALEQQEDLEFWIVRAAPEVLPADLLGCKLPLTQGRTTHSRQLELTADTFVPPGLHLLLPNKKGKKLKPVSLALMGQISVHQRLAAPGYDVTDENMTSSRQGPPSPPKARPDRHPLLGVGYADELKRRKRALEISQSLGDATSQPVVTQSAKKKKSTRTS